MFYLVSKNVHTLCHEITPLWKIKMFPALRINQNSHFNISIYNFSVRSIISDLTIILIRKYVFHNSISNLSYLLARSSVFMSVSRRTKRQSRWGMKHLSNVSSTVDAVNNGLRSVLSLLIQSFNKSFIKMQQNDRIREFLRMTRNRSLPRTLLYA